MQSAIEDRSCESTFNFTSNFNPNAFRMRPNRRDRTRRRARSPGVPIVFNQLEEIHRRPEPFEFYTAADLWTDEHTSKQMLAYHLNGDVDISSRRFSFIDKSAGWIVSRFDLREGKSVADFGCGPGLYAERLAQTRAAVTGIDFSKSSLEYAERRAKAEKLNIRYIHQNYLEFHSDDRFDLILMIMCDYCALGPGQRKSLLGKFKSLLKPGGSILLDVYSLKAFDQKTESATCEPDLMDHFWSPEKYYGFRISFTYEDAKATADKYTIVERNRTRTVCNWLQYYSRESLARELAESGFAVEEFLANVAGDPFDADGNEFAVIAQTKGRGMRHEPTRKSVP
jgi:SAM-dependent methyltransferase